jgi:hypothetical protein
MCRSASDQAFARRHDEGNRTVYHAHHIGLGLDNLVVRRGLVALANVAIAVRCATQHAHLPLTGAVTLTP